MRFQNGEKSLAKGGFELGSIASKSSHLSIYSTPLKLMLNECVFSVDYPNHTLVGEVTVNRLCQQGGLFALSVNSVKLLIHCVGTFYNICYISSPW